MPNEVTQRNRRRTFELTQRGHETLQLFTVAIPAAVTLILAVFFMASCEKQSYIEAKEIALERAEIDREALKKGMIQEMAAIPGREKLELIWIYPDEKN